MFLLICTQLKSNCVTTLQICEWPLYAQVEQKSSASCGRTLRQVASRCFSLIIEDSELLWYRFVFFLIINYLKCVCIEKNKYKLPEVCFHLGLHKQIHYMKAHAGTCEWWKNTSSQTLVCLEDMILENPVWYNAQFYPGGHKRVSLLVPNTDGSWQALGLL